MTGGLKVGIAGAGLIAGVHARAYSGVPGVEIVAISDPVEAKAQRLASQVGARTVADAAALIDLGVDIVSVCTPSPTHAGIAVSALEAGLSVLCEKPIARTLEDGRRILAASQGAAGILMVGHVSRFEPDHHQAKQVIDAGHLGQVQMMSHSITTSMPGWSEVGWLGDIEMSGGPLVDLAVHSFDFLSWATGSHPVRVTCVGADTAVGPATYALATLRYATGAIALVEASWAHPASHGFKLSTEFVGTDGRLSWDYDSIGGGFLHGTDRETVRFDPLGERGFQAEILAFVEAVRDGSPSPVPASDGFSALRTSLAALESLRTGTTIELSDGRVA